MMGRFLQRFQEIKPLPVCLFFTDLLQSAPVGSLKSFYCSGFHLSKTEMGCGNRSVPYVFGRSKGVCVKKYTWIVDDLVEEGKGMLPQSFFFFFHIT